MRSLEELSQAIRWYASYVLQHQLFETSKGLNAISDELDSHAARTVSSVPGSADPNANL